MKISQPVIGYTLGDQAGIGPEIIAKALPQLPQSAGYRLIGQAIDCPLGQPSPETAKYALEHLELAAEQLREGKIDALVTAPVCKETLHKVGFRFPGQTEFFADRLSCNNFAMCLTGDKLTVTLCTTHVALRDVPALLTTEEIVRVATLTANFLTKTGHCTPRVAIAGLNPHNGEAGAFGDEESRIIAPALLQLQQMVPGTEFTGPCVPDCVYRDAVQGMYDAVVAPYHDQALIPLKLINFDSGVNATIGLPRLRVSPDHGTAFNIAGKGIASPQSTISAFRLAIKSAQN